MMVNCNQLKVCIILHRFNKSSFVYDENSTEKKYDYMMPVGLSYITSYLKKNNFDVDFINLNHREGLIKDIIAKEFKNNKYDFVFIGSVSVYYPNIRDCIKYIRDISPNTKIVAGGGLVSSQPEIIFDLIKPDFIIIGEGEQTSVELLNCAIGDNDFSHVNGLGYKNNDGNLIVNDPRHPIMDLDSLPFPDHDNDGFNEYLDHLLPSDYVAFDRFDNPRYYPILMSRSCPYNCTFCYHPIGQKYRQRSIDNIMSEIIYVTKKYKINIFIGYDELFSNDEKRIIEFCKKFNDFRKTISWDIQWNFSLRVDNVNDKIVKIMKEAGCFMISLGLESYDHNILKSMKKHITPQQIDNAVRIITDNDVAIQGTFIFGDPAETMNSVKNTLNYYKHNRNILRSGVQLGFIMLFQGSHLYKYCVKNGLVTDEIEFIKNRAKDGFIFYEPVNLTDNLSDSDFKRVKSDVMDAVYTAGNYISPISSNIDNGTNEIHIRCPYCHKIFVVKNIPNPKWNAFQNIGCRYCNGRFEMVSKYYIIWIFLVKTIGFYNILTISRLFSKVVKK
jgi:anaerobic magnesium-protoporphyrin IX monomethyl ester cyclase